MSLFLIRGKIVQPTWPSGRGQEIGSLHGYLEGISNDLNRPFFYDDKVVSTFILDQVMGLAVVGLELSYLPKGLTSSTLSAYFEEHPTFFAIYIDAGENPGPYRNYIQSCCGEHLRLDWHSE